MYLVLGGRFGRILNKRVDCHTRVTLYDIVRICISHIIYMYMDVYLEDSDDFVVFW